MSLVTALDCQRVFNIDNPSIHYSGCYRSCGIYGVFVNIGLCLYMPIGVFMEYLETLVAVFIILLIGHDITPRDLAILNYIVLL